MTERELAICARVKLVREKIKWPQSDFSKELLITRDQLASIEYGRTPLRYKVAYVICYVFDINCKWLATGEGQPNPYYPLLWTAEDKSKFSDQDLLSKVYDLMPQQFEPQAFRKLTPKALGPDFDAKSFLIRKVLDWFDQTIFVDPEAEKKFALDMYNLGNEKVLEYRKEGLATRAKISYHKWQRLAKHLESSRDA